MASSFQISTHELYMERVMDGRKLKLAAVHGQYDQGASKSSTLHPGSHANRPMY